MKDMADNKYLVFVLRLVCGILFIYAAQSKILNTAEFATAIRAYDIIPDTLSTLPAIFLPWIELYCGIFLLAGIYTRSTAAIAAGLMILFTINILIALVRGLEIDCGCGASVTGVDRVSWPKIIENSVLVFALYIISSRDSFKWAFDNRLKTKS